MANNQMDPDGWIHLLVGGILAGAGKWVWDRLARTPRPPKEGHDVAYIRAHVERIMREEGHPGDSSARQRLNDILDGVDQINGRLDGIEDRVCRLEARRAIGAD